MNEELTYAATLPPGVIYLKGEDVHNSKEDNEAFRRTWDETNARYRALCKELEDETKEELP
jgi:hypothetical protein